MKIDPFSNKLVDNVQKNKGHVKDKNGFQSQLDEAMSSRAISSIKTTGKAMELPPVHPTFLTEIKDKNNTVADTVKKLDAALSSLEFYQSALNNPAIEERRMKGLLQNIIDQKDDILTLMKGMPDGNKLKEILRETALVIIEETNRYYRSSATA